MKKRITCFVLALLLCLSSISLFSCSSNTDNEKKDDEAESYVRNPMTLSVWIPTDEGTSDDAAKLVQDELNKITRAQYSTSIELHLIPSATYEAVIEEKMASVSEILESTANSKKQSSNKNSNNDETTETAADQAETDDSGETTYAPVSSSQMDVFLIRGYDNFMKYAEEGRLSQIDDELNGNAKLIKSYVYPTFIDQATLYGAKVAVGNSHPIGEYTYLLINKELCDSMYYDPSEMKSLLDCQDFIEDIGLGDSGVTPLLSEADTAGLHYWSNENKDENGNSVVTYSVLASMIQDSDDYTAKLNIRNIFALKPYTRTVTMMKKLQERGYIGNDSQSVDFGVGVIKGNAKDLAKYGIVFDEEGNINADESKYYVNILSKPRATCDDIYQALFAVSAYTKDVRRSMEIIQLINTDSQFRTILQYGVENVHWKVDPSSPSDDPYIMKLKDDYNMNLVETGNVFITYPDYGVSMSYWRDGENQNLDSMIDPLIRFTNYVNDTNRSYFEKLEEESAKIFAKVEGMSAEEFENSINDLKSEVEKLDVYSKLTRTKIDDDGFEPLAYKYGEYYAEYMQPKE